MNRSIPPKPMKLDNSWAMRRLQRRRFAGLRPEPATRSQPMRAALAIAGDLLVILIIVGAVAASAIFAGA